jgi:hypothetical protein
MPFPSSRYPFLCVIARIKIKSYYTTLKTTYVCIGTQKDNKDMRSKPIDAKEVASYTSYFMLV